MSGSSDQRFVVSASADLTNRVWDIIAGACLKVIRAHQETVKSVAIDLSTVITGGADGLIGVWAFKPPVMQPPRKKQRRQRNDDGPPPKSLGDPMVGTCPGFLYGLRDTRAVCALRWQPLPSDTSSSSCTTTTTTTTYHCTDRGPHSS